ncbi:response regulator transcription factor [Actinoplanes sp. HUAS TT8]|uniref:response regulator transcription factor n=1 Tax=Actinoplanes sp. HUAS TT8 TaxID=3447453 RepID=UPI003F525008
MRIVIAEDSVLLREGLVRLFSGAGFDVVAAVGNAEQLHLVADEHDPDLVITDVRMPPTFSDEGLRAALALRERKPGIAVLVLSQYVEERYASELLSGDTNGVGYLLKDRVADVDEFLLTARRVAEGGTAFDPEVVSQLLVRHRSDPLRLLTEREAAVLSLMAEGKSNAGVAQSLVVSESAVAKHVSSIFTKLGLSVAESGHRRVLAVLKYIRAGMG